jgi:hypothetical protein
MSRPAPGSIPGRCIEILSRALLIFLPILVSVSVGFSGSVAVEQSSHRARTTARNSHIKEDGDKSKGLLAPGNLFGRVDTDKFH